MKTRIAAHHDAPQLAELLKHWHRHEFESKRYASRQGPCGPGTHVAERDGTIVGWLTGSHANENANEMGNYADRPNRRCSVLLAMYVDGAHQDDGIGTDLVKAFLQEGEKAGNTMAYVHPDANTDLERLWRFYERLGFPLQRPANRRISRRTGAWPGTARADDTTTAERYADRHRLPAGRGHEQAGNATPQPRTDPSLGRKG